MAKVIELRAGDSVSIDDGRVTVTMEAKSGKVARLRFEAARDIPIQRVVSGVSAAAMVAKNGIGQIGSIT